MKISDVTKLTDSQLTRLIAKLEGYKMYNRRLDNRWATRTQIENGKRIIVHTEIPYYHRDLNAMADAVAHQVELKGTSFYLKFNNCLAHVLGHHDHLEDEMVHATARQRAMAFVLAVTNE